MSSPSMDVRTFITGATGFIGAHVLDQLLSRTQHTAVVALRSISSKQLILDRYANDQDKQERLQFVEVKNLAESAAVADALRGVTYIMHVASPFAWEVKSNRHDLIEPAIALTQSILNAAQQTESIKRIVFTGSFSSIMNPLRGDIKRDYTYTEADWNPLTNKFLASLYGPAAYLASKTLAEKKVWEHISKKKPHFDAVVFCPPMVYGPLIHKVEKPESLNESSAQVYKLFGASQVPGDDTPFCDVRDVASLHVAALDHAAASNKRYLLCGGNVSWQAVCDAARSRYPDWASELLPRGEPGRDFSGKLATLDVTKAETDFQYRFRTWQECIVEDELPQLYSLRQQWQSSA